MVLDTNVMILFSKGDVGVVNTLLAVLESLIISRITYIEFLADKRLTEEEAGRAKQFLIEQFSIVDIGEEVGDTAIEIRKRGALKLPDALVVATAMVLGQKLCTLDSTIRKAFPKIVVPE